MNRIINAHRIRPAVDKISTFEEATEEYRYFEEQQHFGKVLIQVSGQKYLKFLTRSDSATPDDAANKQQ